MPPGAVTPVSRPRFELLNLWSSHVINALFFFFFFTRGGNAPCPFILNNKAFWHNCEQPPHFTPCAKSRGHFVGGYNTPAPRRGSRGRGSHRRPFTLTGGATMAAARCLGVIRRFKGLTGKDDQQPPFSLELAINQATHFGAPFEPSAHAPVEV